MKQSVALDILKAGRNVYLTGPAGSGKTHTLREYIEYLKNHGVVLGITASTGIAATHFGGVTIHSWSGIGIKEKLSEYDIEMLTQKEYLHKRYNKTQVLIIDEVSMLSPDFFDSLDALAKALRGSKDPFGGMQIVLSGDFFQLPPVVKGEQKIAFINSSKAWRDMNLRICYLTEQFRQSDGDSLTQILNEIRGGEVTEESRFLLGEQVYAEFGEGVRPTRLFTHNRDVDALNKKELDGIDDDDVFVSEMDTRGKRTLVDGLKNGVLAPENLELKREAVVMFVKNNFDAGYVNGTLGVVEDFEDEMPVVRTFDGKYITVAPASWTIEDNDKVMAEVRQFPLRLAWAITIHKSQGMSLDAAEINLSNSFVPGQGYVALSRLRTLSGLLLKGMNEIALSVNSDVLKLDGILRKDSDRWETAIGRFSKKEVQKMHEEFILKAGGTLDKKEIAKNKAKEAESMAEKKSTYEQTRELLAEGKDLEAVAEVRGVTLGTVISHLEKLKKDGAELAYDRFKPKANDLKKIRKAFEDLDGDKLTPVFKRLDGEYTFEELRLARIFIE